MFNKPRRLSISEYVLTHYRSLFAVAFLLPLSALYNLFNYTRNKIRFMQKSAPKKHVERVKLIQAQIEAWKQNGARGKLCTNRSPWLAMSELVPQYKKDRTKITINLSNILGIDTERKVVRVEPLVSMGQISAALYSKEWTLPVLPELDDLTVGGLIMGFGIETSSHKHGLFQHICQSFDLVTAEGELIKCWRNENASIFYSIPWSYGTLGFLVAAELSIIPAAQYIKLQYIPLHGLDNIVSFFEAESRNTAKNDFVECLQWDLDKAVVMTGNFIDEALTDAPVNSIGRWYKPWFYKHVETYLLNNNRGTEYIPLRQYYHRHTRSLFWEMEGIISFGNNPVFRLLLGWALPPQISLLKYFETETIKELREQHHMVQDMLMPMQKLKLSIQYFHQNFKIYPIWLCPMAIHENDNHTGFIHPFTQNGKTDQLYVDIGVYGVIQKQDFDATAALHNLEQFVIENSGYQALYAKTLLSKDDLRKMFDYTFYDNLRQLLPFCNEAFGEVYDKVGGNARVAPSDFRKK